ncbi:MAG TPA: SgcJ/EcaC family oxidoreductase [Candidatus Acidoferrum sp.]|nr:SgcJ/EcaC family oxidoreductase [Candidatus Acidoferrum sp.]
MNANEEAVGAVLAKYQKALNASDTDAVMKLYAWDGVFMPQNSPSSIGSGALRKAYEAVFGAITLSVKFEIAEIRQIAPDWVFARTNSAGTTKVHATGAGGREANQELFLFQKVHDVWKIARYCFSATNPPRA